jgi:hypothetical protein
MVSLLFGLAHEPFDNGAQHSYHRRNVIACFFCVRSPGTAASAVVRRYSLHQTSQWQCFKHTPGVSHWRKGAHTTRYYTSLPPTTACHYICTLKGPMERPKQDAHQRTQVCNRCHCNLHRSVATAPFEKRANYEYIYLLSGFRGELQPRREIVLN